jgi:hypothetical protein
MNNPIITPALIREHDPCYDPVTGDLRVPNPLPEGYSAPLSEFLRLGHIPAPDRIWLATRPGILPDRILRLWTVAIARRALGRAPNPDPRSVAACDVAERYANGEATVEELGAAQRAAQEAEAAADAWAAAAVARAVWAAKRALAAAAVAAAAADAAAEALAEVAAAAARATERQLQLQLDDLIALIEG